MSRQTQRRPIVRGALTVVTVAGLALGFEAITSASAQSADGFAPRPYVGVSAGVSRLEPKSRSEALEVADEVDAGLSVFAGYDFTRWLSAEVYFADLGSAGIEFLGRDVGDVDYQVYGVNALGYLYNSRAGFGLDAAGSRRGLSLYLGLGAGGMNNDSDLAFRKDYDAHVSFSGGLEYGFDNGIALRAQLTSFDTDAQYASLSVLKRFGSTAATAAPGAKRAQAPSESVVPPARPATGSLPDGPTYFRPLVPPYVYFAFNDASLDADAKDKLDSFAAALADTDFSVAVDGHADWLGPEAYNTTLSRRRAEAVHAYLVAAGVDAQRLEVRAFGESQPVSTNLSAEGRAQNRRTDFTLR